MAYKIIATAEIAADDEDDLKTKLASINTFVNNAQGRVNVVIRTDES